MCIWITGCTISQLAFFWVNCSTSVVDPKRQLSLAIHRLNRKCPTHTGHKMSISDIEWHGRYRNSSAHFFSFEWDFNFYIVYVLIATSWVCRRRKGHAGHVIVPLVDEESLIWKFWNRVAEIACFQLSIQTWGSRINIMECLKSIEKLHFTNFWASKLPKTCPSIPCPIPWRSYQCRAFLARTVATWCNCLSTQEYICGASWIH